MACLPRLAALLLVVGLLTFASPAHAWVSNLEPGVRPHHIAVDAMGNILVTGWLYDDSVVSLYTARYSRLGVLQWRAVEGGISTDSYGAWTDAADAATLIDSRGDVYVTGKAPAGGLSGAFVVIKYDGETGDRKWMTAITRVDGSPAAEGAGTTLALDPAGFVFAGGYAEPAVSNRTGVVARLRASTGALEWAVFAAWEVDALAIDRSGNPVVTGPSLYAAKLHRVTGRDMWRQEGSPARRRRGTRPYAVEALIHRTGDVFLAGRLRNSPWDKWEFYLARLNGATGAIRWEYTPGGGSYGLGVARFRFGPLGDVYACGQHNEKSGAVVRIAHATGKKLWLREPWRGKRWPDYSVVSDLAVDSRRLYVCGSGEVVERILVASYDSRGRARWKRDSGTGYPTAITTAPGDRLYLLTRFGRVNYGLVGLRASNGAHLPAQ